MRLIIKAAGYNPFNGNIGRQHQITDNDFGRIIEGLRHNPEYDQMPDGSQRTNEELVAYIFDRFVQGLLDASFVERRNKAGTDAQALVTKDTSSASDDNT